MTRDRIVKLFLQGPVVLFKWRNLERWPMEYVSPNVEQVIGYRPDELLSGHIAYADLIHADDIERVEREVFEYQARRYFYHTPYRLRSKHGRDVWVADHTKTVIEGEDVTHFVGYVMNITKQIEAQNQVREERNLLRTLIDVLPDFVYVKDTQGRFVLNNAASLSALGATTQDEVTGKTDADFFPEDLAAQYAVDERKILDSKTPTIGREEMNVSSNGTLWVSATKVPLYDTHGELIGLVGLNRNISRLKSTQHQLEHMRDELQAVIRIFTDGERRELALKRKTDRILGHDSIV